MTMTIQNKFEALKKEIETLKNRKIRGEEQLKIANEKYIFSEKQLLETTGKSSVKEAISYIENEKKSLLKIKEELNAEYEEFLKAIEEI